MDWDGGSNLAIELAMKVTVSKRRANGKPSWCVDWHPANEKRQRKYCKSENAAEILAASIRLQHHEPGKSWTVATEAQRAELITVWNEMLAVGESPRRVWDAFKSSPQGSGPPLREVVTDFLTTKKAAGRSKQYLSGLKTILNQFAVDHWSKPIGKITLADVEAFINSKSSASRSTIRARLSTLFKFAVRRGQRADNPCARLEPMTVAKSPPQILTVEQFQTCLKWIRKNARHGLPWFVLTTCCGLRPEEAEKTRKADIHVKEGWIKVEAQTTKVRQRRVVYPKREAMALLKRSLRSGRLPLGASATDRLLSGTRWKNKKGIQTRRGLRDAFGWKAWPKDITRHTAASYWLADCQSTATVARSLGNSETVLLRHYAALVTREQAKQFWRAVKGR